MTIDPMQIIVALVIGGVILVALADFGVLTRIRRQFSVPTVPDWQQGLPSSDATTDAQSADQVYFDSAERFLNTQVATNDVLDTKTAGAVSLGSTILPLTFGLLSISGKTFPGVTQKFLVAAVVAYVLLIVAAARTSYIRGIEYRPNIRRLWENSQAVDGIVLRRWVAEEYAASSEINQIVLEYKARWVGRVTLVLYVEGIMISAAAVAALISMQ